LEQAHEFVVVFRDVVVVSQRGTGSQLRPLEGAPTFEYPSAQSQEFVVVFKYEEVVSHSGVTATLAVLVGVLEEVPVAVDARFVLDKVALDDISEGEVELVERVGDKVELDKVELAERVDDEVGLGKIVLDKAEIDSPGQEAAANCTN
jgi:hypothetical protein